MSMGLGSCLISLGFGSLNPRAAKLKISSLDIQKKMIKSKHISRCLSLKSSISAIKCPLIEDLVNVRIAIRR
jgi:hypothetical protein